MTPQAPFTASVWKLGDNVNTDLLHPPDYFSLNEDRMKAGIREGMQRLDTAVSARQSSGNIVIIAGINFGCGSSRETSVRALRAVGVKAVVARSFGRIFFRSLFNLGLLPLVCKDLPEGIRDGDTVTFDPKPPCLRLDGRNPFPLDPLDAHAEKVIAHGGLITYLLKELSET